ncbi:MAG: alpha/beta hydrolase [Parvibaculaceae bacterium]|nr:alpha/beta hydrolase [Parvibaculaceae bacterium]
MEFFRSDGLDLAYEVAGEGRPIMLVHGFASTHRVNWIDTGWVQTLNKAGFMVVMADGRGHGQSAAPHDHESYALDRMAGDVVRLMDHLAIPQADLMGYSMGGMVSLMAASLTPERFSHVIGAGIGETLLRGERHADAIVAALQAPDLRSVANNGARVYRVFADMNRQDRVAMAFCIEKILEPFPLASLAAIDVPVLIATGDKDVNAGDPHVLAARIPGAKVAVIPGRDHMKAVGDKVYKAAALDFLAE